MIKKSITFDEITALKRAYFEAVIEYENVIYWNTPVDKEAKHELGTNMRIAKDALRETGIASYCAHAIENLAKQTAEFRRERLKGNGSLRDWSTLASDVRMWSLGRV